MRAKQRNIPRSASGVLLDRGRVGQRTRNGAGPGHENSRDMGAFGEVAPRNGKIAIVEALSSDRWVSDGNYGKYGGPWRRSIRSGWSFVGAPNGWPRNRRRQTSRRGPGADTRRPGDICPGSSPGSGRRPPGHPLGRARQVHLVQQTLGIRAHPLEPLVEDIGRLMHPTLLGAGARQRLLQIHPAWGPAAWPADSQIIGQVRWMARTL